LMGWHMLTWLTQFEEQWMDAVFLRLPREK
jgi:hypothetical protein